ncbi:hypothetical protein STEG23_001011, partial [Scotinomys teguina]
MDKTKNTSQNKHTLGCADYSTYKQTEQTLCCCLAPEFEVHIWFQHPQNTVVLSNVSNSCTALQSRFVVAFDGFSQLDSQSLEDSEESEPEKWLAYEELQFAPSWLLLVVKTLGAKPCVWLWISASASINIILIERKRTQEQPVTSEDKPQPLPETQEQPVTLRRRGPRSSQSSSEEEDQGTASHPQRKRTQEHPDTMEQETSPAPHPRQKWEDINAKVPAASHRVDGSNAVTGDESFTAACSEKNHQDHGVTRKYRQ